MLLQWIYPDHPLVKEFPAISDKCVDHGNLLIYSLIVWRDTPILSHQEIGLDQDGVKIPKKKNMVNWEPNHILDWKDPMHLTILLAIFQDIEKMKDWEVLGESIPI
jgi:hypothetical protein